MALPRGLAEEMPLVTVVIPTRNRPDLVSRAVRSGLGQTYTNIEVVVVIDGPDELTRRALALIEDDRLHVIELDDNAGGAEARNVGVRAAQGEWIAFLDDDDDWLPEKIETQVKAIPTLPNPNSFIGCRFTIRTDAGFETHPLRLPDPGEHIDDYIFCPKRFRTGEGFLQTSTLMAPRELLLGVPFVRGLRRGQESAWMLRACAYGNAGFYVVPEVLSHFNSDSLSDANRVSAVPKWRSFYDWMQANRACFSQRSFSSCIATSVLPDAIKADEPFSVQVGLFRDCLTNGRPSVKCIFKAAYVLFLPASLRSIVTRGRFKSVTQSPST